MKELNTTKEYFKLPSETNQTITMEENTPPKGFIENGNNDINIKIIAYYEDEAIYLNNGNFLKSPYKKEEIRELIKNAQ